MHGGDCAREGYELKDRPSDARLRRRSLARSSLTSNPSRASLRQANNDGLRTRPCNDGGTRHTASLRAKRSNPEIVTSAGERRRPLPAPLSFQIQRPSPYPSRPRSPDCFAPLAMTDMPNKSALCSTRAGGAGLMGWTPFVPTPPKGRGAQGEHPPFDAPFAAWHAARRPQDGGHRLEQQPNLRPYLITPVSHAPGLTSEAIEAAHGSLRRFAARNDDWCINLRAECSKPKAAWPALEGRR
jgi:hypothetical protein